MNSHEIRRYTMLTRVLDFGDTHPDVAAQSPLAREQFARVATAVEQLRDRAVAQMASARTGRTAKASARRTLGTHLTAIARTARALAQDTAGLERRFKLRKPLSDLELVTNARLFLRDAEPLTDAFVAHGLAPTFLTELQAHIEAFERTLRGGEAEKAEHATVRADIQAAFRSGMAAARRLDAIVANRHGADATTAAAWQRARRLDPVRRTRSLGAEAPDDAAPDDAAPGNAPAPPAAPDYRAATPPAASVAPAAVVPGLPPNAPGAPSAPAIVATRMPWS